MTDVSAVIGNFQGEHLLPDVLESLGAQTRAPREVLVVDGSSTDGSRTVAEEYGARFLAQPNRGLGFLYNRGAESATAPYVLFLNNDVALEPDCVEQLAGALDADEGRFAADAKQLDWQGTRTIHARTTLSRGPLVREYLPGLRLDPIVPADEVVPTVCANGAAMLVRRAQHLALRGFDETFFMEWEDLDLCWRAWLHGWATVYVPGAVVRHRVGAATSDALLPRRQASSHHNLMRFALKSLPPVAAARVIVGELLRWPRYPATIAHALLAIAREAPEIARLRRTTAPRRALLETMIDGSPATLVSR